MYYKTIDIALAVENQINFPCRKMRVRRRMDFDDDLDSPTKSSRKDKLFTVKLLINLVIYMISFYRKLWYCWRDLADRLTRSSSRRTQTAKLLYSFQTPQNLCKSQEPSQKSLFKYISYQRSHIKSDIEKQWHSSETDFKRKSRKSTSFTHWQVNFIKLSS